MATAGARPGYHLKDPRAAPRGSSRMRTDILAGHFRRGGLNHCAKGRESLGGGEGTWREEEKAQIVLGTRADSEQSRPWNPAGAPRLSPTQRGGFRRPLTPSACVGGS